MEGGIKQREEKEREMKQTLPPLHRKRLVIPILFGALHVHICIHPGLGHHAWPSHRFSDLLRQIDLPKAKEEEQRLWLSSSASVLVRLPSYKTVVYTIYHSTIKSAKEKKRGPKKKHKRIHSFLLSTKTSCRTKTKRGTNLY
jgi:hypothetical protein